MRGDRKDAAFQEAKAALQQFNEQYPVSTRRTPSSTDLSCHSSSSAGVLAIAGDNEDEDDDEDEDEEVAARGTPARARSRVRVDRGTVRCDLFGTSTQSIGSDPILAESNGSRDGNLRSRNILSSV